MQCYRLFEAIPERSALGYGPGGGRWNYAGTPIIYTAHSVALAFLELYSIIGAQVALSKWVLANLEVPDQRPQLEMEGAPSDWNCRPISNSTRDLGSTWAHRNESLCLAVPSARLPLISYPTEHNLLINPLHPDFDKLVKVIKETEVSIALD